MKEIDLENYIGALLNKPTVDKSILSEVQNIQLILTAYRLGLEKEVFDPVLLLREFELETDIPAQFHAEVAKMAILKSKKSDTKQTGYLLDAVLNSMYSFKNYFIRVK